MKCNHMFEVDLNNPPGECPKCGFKFRIITHNVSDKKGQKRGGFILEPLNYDPVISKNELYDFICRNPESYITELAEYFGSSRNTMRKYVRELENENHVVVTQKKGSYCYVKPNFSTTL